MLAAIRWIRAIRVQEQKNKPANYTNKANFAGSKEQNHKFLECELHSSIKTIL